MNQLCCPSNKNLFRTSAFDTLPTVEASAPDYQRHKPEQTLLYQIIKHHYLEFQVLMEAQNRPLPKYVQQEFDEYLRCGRL